MENRSKGNEFQHQARQCLLELIGVLHMNTGSEFHYILEKSDCSKSCLCNQNQYIQRLAFILGMTQSGLMLD